MAKRYRAAARGRCVRLVFATGWSGWRPDRTLKLVSILSRFMRMDVPRTGSQLTTGLSRHAARALSPDGRPGGSRHRLSRPPIRMFPGSRERFAIRVINAGMPNCRAELRPCCPLALRPCRLRLIRRGTTCSIGLVYSEPRNLFSLQPVLPDPESPVSYHSLREPVSPLGNAGRSRGRSSLPTSPCPSRQLESLRACTRVGAIPSFQPTWTRFPVASRIKSWRRTRAQVSREVRRSTHEDPPAKDLREGGDSFVDPHFSHSCETHRRRCLRSSSPERAGHPHRGHPREALRSFCRPCRHRHTVAGSAGARVVSQDSIAGSARRVRTGDR